MGTLRVGVDEGQTTIRLRHAYGELGKVGAGQYWSPFMDIDVFPNTLEYWGPTGMVFFRNVQLRFMPIQGDTRMTIALERPGASGDQGSMRTASSSAASSRASASRIFPPSTAEPRTWATSRWPAFSAASNGTTLADSLDLSGNVTGWGVNLSSNIKIGGQHGADRSRTAKASKTT
jgi:hypothetical protein